MLHGKEWRKNNMDYIPAQQDPFGIQNAVGIYQKGKAQTLSNALREQQLQQFEIKQNQIAQDREAKEQQIMQDSIKKNVHMADRNNWGLYVRDSAKAGIDTSYYPSFNEVRNMSPEKFEEMKLKIAGQGSRLAFDKKRQSEAEARRQIPDKKSLMVEQARADKDYRKAMTTRKKDIMSATKDIASNKAKLNRIISGAANNDEMFMTMKALGIDLPGLKSANPAEVEAARAEAKEAGQQYNTELEGRKETLQGEEINEAVAHYGNKYDVDPNIINAIIKTESNFNPIARSEKGAQGLMQLMPKTAASLGLRGKAVLDPEKNIAAGVKYFKDIGRMLGKDDSLENRLIAYNWGIGNFRKYQKGLKQLPKETSDYIKKVTKELQNVQDEQQLQETEQDIPNEELLSRIGEEEAGTEDKEFTMERKFETDIEDKDPITPQERVTSQITKAQSIVSKVQADLGSPYRAGKALDKTQKLVISKGIKDITKTMHAIAKDLTGSEYINLILSLKKERDKLEAMKGK